MSLSDLASLGSFISGLAVIATLVFLALQMRQTNLNQRALMQLGRSTRTADTILRIADRNAAETYIRAARGDPTLGEAELFSYAWMVTAQHMNWEDTYLQHQAGLLDDDSFTTDQATLRTISATPGGRLVWRTIRLIFGPAYRAYVDQTNSETPLSAGLDLSAIWKAEFGAGRSTGS